jgi:DNA-binding PadR family transcriptional regulator
VRPVPIDQPLSEAQVISLFHGDSGRSHYYVLSSYVIRSRVRGMALKTNNGRRPNDPPILILTSLAGGPKHGHALARDIQAFAGVALGPGALYGAITRLEERGLIEPLESDDRRRPYRISAAGSAYLSEAVAEMQRLAGEGARRLAGANHVSRGRGPRIAGSPA